MAGFEQAERFEGIWNGEEVHPKRVWSGHRFTDDECKDLLDGREIVIDAVSNAGKPYKCKGKLAKQEYNGNEYVGFLRTGFVNDGPSSWCKHVFTDDERKKLMNGDTIKCIDFVGNSGKSFKAEIKWDKTEGKIAVVEFIK